MANFLTIALALATPLSSLAQERHETASSVLIDASSLSLEDAFESFKMRFQKKYASPKEESERFEIFKRNAANALEEETSGITKFSDLTDDEFSDRYLGFRQNRFHGEERRYWDGSCYACDRFPGVEEMAGEDSFDWTEKGAVTGVKTQNCGDCYAFGTTGDIEGSWFLAGNDLVTLSEEEIVDCCFEDMSILQCAGCAGGEPHEVFDWLIEKKSGHLSSESTYPYVVPKRQPHPGTCKRNTTASARISSWYWVSSSGEGEANMTTQLPKVGPFVIGIDATDAKMKAYTGGIAKPDCKENPVLDHAVLVVGYGTENGVDYWKIKNSWGTDWGESGYYRIVRGVNSCGLANDVVHSVV